MRPEDVVFDKMAAKELPKYTEILKECAKIGEERMSKYDNPLRSMKVASEILETTFGIKLSIEEICYVLVALKFSRQTKSFNEDNLLDSINYLAIALNSRRYDKRK
jgi:phenylalanyl-tRNA synthetase beta subunit